MDNLEKHIRENRSDLDRYEPSPAVWEKIRKNTGTGRPLYKWLSVAAAAAVITGSAFLLLTATGKEDRGYKAAGKMDPSLKETEYYYNTMVNDLYSEAKPLMIRQPDIEKEVDTGIAQLDSICADLKKDLKDNVSNQEVIEALVTNYRIKIRLLEEMLTILKEKENENGQAKTRNHEM